MKNKVDEIKVKSEWSCCNDGDEKNVSKDCNESMSSVKEEKKDSKDMSSESVE